MSVQTIHRTTHASNFTILPNAIWQSGLSISATSALGYILSKPPTWKIRITDLRNKLGIGRDRVYKALNELVRAGYAKMTRLQRGVRWEFFDTPQTDSTPEPIEPKADSRLPEIQRTERREALERNEIPSLVSNEIQQQAATLNVSTQPTEAPSVVVHEESVPATDPVLIAEIERLPLEPKERKVAERTLSNLPLAEVKAIIAVYVTALTKGGIDNKLGYLVGLKKASQNGTLTPILATQTLTPAQRLAKEAKAREDDLARHKVTNDAWAKEMINKLGMEAALKIMPWYVPQ